MFEEIVNNKTCKISECSSKAYEEALAPNHTFLVKTAARAAMMATPNRKNILHMVVESDKTDEFAYETISEIVKAMKPVRDGLWNYYR
jgi:hypothetical protein